MKEKENWGLTNAGKWSIIHKLTAIAVDTEKSRSWPSAHDWKSCIPQKGIEGSNPSFSAIKPPPFGGGFFMNLRILFDILMEAYENVF